LAKIGTSYCLIAICDTTLDAVMLDLQIPWMDNRMGYSEATAEPPMVVIVLYSLNELIIYAI